MRKVLRWVVWRRQAEGEDGAMGEMREDGVRRRERDYCSDDERWI